MEIEKLDIDKELERLIEKYKLDRHYPAYRTSRRACSFIKKWVKQLGGIEKEILFLGMDEYALKLIGGWAYARNVDTILIESVEELEKDTRKGYFERLKGADEIYVVSYTRTIEILHWLWRHDFHAESVYDILENEQIYLQMEFYRFFTPIKMTLELALDESGKERSVDGSSLVLYEFYYQKQRFDHSVCEKKRIRIAEKLFFLAICMRNFLEAERILSTMRDSKLGSCWQEIQQLVLKIKKAMLSSQQNNIIIYWLDALSYEESSEMSYLQSRRAHSVYFHNAYTVTPYTSPTCKNMFCKIQQVDDCGYKVRDIDWENSFLLRELEEQGYRFSIVGDYLSRFFEEKYSISENLMICSPCSEVFWRLAAQMLQCEQKTVYLVHAFVELHPPTLSVRRNYFENQYCDESRKLQLLELDEQLHFYDEMLGSENYRVYMSDHGIGNLWERVHVHFQVYHISWKGQETQRLYCPLDFGTIIHQLLVGKKIDDDAWSREYIPLQEVDFYNKNKLKEMFTRKRGFNLRSYVAYKGVISKEGIYVRYKTNDEVYRKWSEKLSDEPVLLTEAEKQLECFQKLRRQAGDFPAELDSDSKFKYAKYTYKAYENVKNTIRAAAELLNEKFDSYADGSIALRMGGEHSRQLYELLAESNRRKIGGIIDKNRNCSCAILGFPVFEPNEQLPDVIEAVLLSSKIFREELKEEAKNLYGSLEVIDIYQYWEKAGYQFQREFYFGQDTDYEVGFPEA